MLRLACIALAAAFAPQLAHAAASTGIFEIDLVFPQNGTYATVPFMPVVFAVQNPELASSLDAQISWSIFEYGSWSHDTPGSWSHDIDLRTLNASTSNPYLSASYNPKMSGIESTWVFTWEITTGNCSRSVGMPSYNNSDSGIIFTTRNSSQPPDLEAATRSPQCISDMGSAFNVTDQISNPDPEFKPSYSCAVLGSTPTTRDSCAVTINASAASSISAAISQSACSASVVSCTATPSPTPSKSAAARPARRHAAWLVAAIASLTSFDVLWTM